MREKSRHYNCPAQVDGTYTVKNKNGRFSLFSMVELSVIVVSTLGSTNRTTREKSLFEGRELT